jgi:hypothetical protein
MAENQKGHSALCVAKAEPTKEYFRHLLDIRRNAQMNSTATEWIRGHVSPEIQAMMLNDAKRSAIQVNEDFFII